MKSISLVREFHRAFGQPVNDEPTLDNDKMNELRVMLIAEELDELVDAMDARDPVAVLDALTDLQYVLDGAYLSLGFAHVKDAALHAVHVSNMTKLGADGKPVYRHDGKVTKGPNYQPPNLAPLLEQDWDSLPTTEYPAASTVRWSEADDNAAHAPPFGGSTREYPAAGVARIPRVPCVCNGVNGPPGDPCICAAAVEPAITDYCTACGDSPDSASHVFDHDYRGEPTNG